MWVFFPKKTGWDFFFFSPFKYSCLISSPSLGCSENGRGLVSPCLDLPPVSAFHQWARDYQSDSESDSDRPEPDLVQDDLASRRFRSTTPATPANFAVPLNPRSIRPFPVLTPSARRSKVTMSDASCLATVPHERSSQRSEFGVTWCGMTS